MIGISDQRLAEIEAWTRGYRQLMRGGLDETVHTAAAPTSEIAPDQFAALRVSDVEALLAEVDRLRDEKDKAQRRIAAVRKLVEESGGPEWSPLARISNDSIIRALAVEDGQT